MRIGPRTLSSAERFSTSLTIKENLWCHLRIRSGAIEFEVGIVEAKVVDGSYGGGGKFGGKQSGILFAGRDDCFKDHVLVAGGVEGLDSWGGVI